MAPKAMQKFQRIVGLLCLWMIEVSGTGTWTVSCVADKTANDK